MSFIQEISNSFYYRRWLTRERKHFFKYTIFILVLEIIVVHLLLNSNYSNNSLSDLIFGWSIIFLFFCIAIFFLFKAFGTYHYKIIFAEKGTILKKKRFKNSDSSSQYYKRYYYFDVKVKNEVFECKGEFLTYKSLAENDLVVVFQIKNDKTFYIIPFSSN